MYNTFMFAVTLLSLLLIEGEQDEQKTQDKLKVEFVTKYNKAKKGGNRQACENMLLELSSNQSKLSEFLLIHIYLNDDDPDMKSRAIGIAAEKYLSSQYVADSIEKFLLEISRSKQRRNYKNVITKSINKLSNMEPQIALSKINLINTYILNHSKQFTLEEREVAIESINAAARLKHNSSIPLLIGLFKELQSDMRGFIRQRPDKKCDGVCGSKCPAVPTLEEIIKNTRLYAAIARYKLLFQNVKDALVTITGQDYDSYEQWFKWWDKEKDKPVNTRNDSSD